MSKLKLVKDETKAARYAELVRVSTDAQADKDTPERQRHDLDQFREHRPGTFVKRIEAPGVSGTLSLADSAEGRELLALANAGKIDELRIVKVSRVFGGRALDPGTRHEIASLCFRLNVVIVETSTGTTYDMHDPQSQFFFMLALGFSAMQKSDFNEVANKGRMSAVRRGRSPGGRHYYGRIWNPLTLKWEFHPEQQQTFNTIKSWLLDDHLSLNEIARRLNKSGVPTLLSKNKGKAEHKRIRPKRQKWTGTTIRGLFKQRHLVGESFYTNTHTPDERGEIKLPALVTEAEWQRIQRYLDSRRPTGRAVDPASKPILIGRLFCQCGRAMYRKKSYYHCSTLHTNAEVAGLKPCEYTKIKKYHRYDTTDAAVWESISRYIMRDVLAEAEDPDSQIDVSKYEDEIAECERALAALKRREAVLAKTYALGEMEEDTWQSTRRTLRSEAAKLNAQLHTAQQTLARLRETQGSQETLEAALRGVRARIATAEPQERRALIHAIIPPTQGYGITLQTDGTAVISAGLLAAPEHESGAGGATGGNAKGSGVPKVSSSARPATQFGYGQIIPFRLKVKVQQPEGKRRARSTK